MGLSRRHGGCQSRFTVDDCYKNNKGGRVDSANLMGMESDVVLRVAINVSSVMVFGTGMVALVYAAPPTANAEIENPPDFVRSISKRTPCRIFVCGIYSIIKFTLSLIITIILISMSFIFYKKLLEEIHLNITETHCILFEPPIKMNNEIVFTWVYRGKILSRRTS